jgi:tetratricopeptide (TPR) repeat protein
VKVIAAALVVVVAVAPVRADPAGATRKDEPKSDKFARAAREAFTQARAAEEAGKLPEALRLYRRAHAISPHPNCLYNIADLERRAGDIRAAIRAYEEYLALDPTAPDRGDVEKLVRELQAMPSKLTVEVEDVTSDAVIFVDGQPLRGTSIDVPAGPHVIDVITAISATSERCDVVAGRPKRCKLHLPPRVDGNVFLSAPAHTMRQSVSRDRFHYAIKSRFQMQPGVHSFYVLSNERYQCAPIKLDVAKGDAVTYAWLGMPDMSTGQPPRGGCATISVQQRTLTFPP